MKIKQAVLFALVLFLIIGLTGCASNTPKAQSTPEAKAPSTVVPPTSKFAKLEIGMARPQVHEKIGVASDFKTIFQGKPGFPFTTDRIEPAPSITTKTRGGWYTPAETTG